MKNFLFFALLLGFVACQQDKPKAVYQEFSSATITVLAQDESTTVQAEGFYEVIYLEGDTADIEIELPNQSIKTRTVEASPGHFVGTDKECATVILLNKQDLYFRDCAGVQILLHAD